LVDAAEAYSVDQRQALLTFYSRTDRIREIVRYEMRESQPDITDFIPDPYSVRDFGGGLAAVDDGLREFRAQITPSSTKPELPSLEDACQYYRFLYFYISPEYGVGATAAHERFEFLQQLDFETLLWRGDDQSSD